MGAFSLIVLINLLNRILCEEKMSSPGEALTNGFVNNTTAAVDVLEYDRSFSNSLYVLISLLCMALIVALTAGYLILHVCCCNNAKKEKCKNCEQQERSVAESASNSEG